MQINQKEGLAQNVVSLIRLLWLANKRDSTHNITPFDSLDLQLT